MVQECKCCYSGSNGDDDFADLFRFGIFTGKLTIMFLRFVLVLFFLVAASCALEGQTGRATVVNDPVPVFPIGEPPYACYRIPAIVALPGGDLLAFAEGRKMNCADFGDVDIVMKRSRDGGRTWSQLSVIADNGDLQAGNCAPVVDMIDSAFPQGRLFLFYNTGTASENSVRQGNGIREVWYITSADQGLTWGKPVNITTQVHRPNQPAVNSAYGFAEDWRAFANTPGHAIQLRYGAYRGRIYVAANHSSGNMQDRYADGRSFGYFSDDHGQTFTISDDLSFPGSNEATAAETASGGVYLNARNQGGTPRCRIAAFSSDGGHSWDTAYFDPRLPDPVCQGSVLTFSRGGEDWLLFANPSSASERRDLTLRISRDNGLTWPGSILLAPGDAAYSDLCQTGGDSVGCLFEKGSDGGIYFLSVEGLTRHRD